MSPKEGHEDDQRSVQPEEKKASGKLVPEEGLHESWKETLCKGR